MKTVPLPYYACSNLLAIVLVSFLIGCSQKNATTSMSAMLGSNIRDDEIQKFISKLRYMPEIDKFDDCFFYNFKDCGISLRFDKTETLTRIFIYSEGSDGFRQFQGKLPYNVSFTMNRNEIESILGKPDKSGGGGVINYWVEYTPKGILITYNTKQTDDQKARIYTVSVSNIH